MCHPGIARGPVHLPTDIFEIPELEQIPEDAVESELIRLQTALETTRRQLEMMRDRIASEIGTNDADIFDAHLLMLEDRSVLDEVFSRIRKKAQKAEGAFYSVMSRYVETLRRIGDEYLRERTVDIEDVARRVVRNLRGTAMELALRCPCSQTARSEVRRRVAPRPEPAGRPRSRRPPTRPRWAAVPPAQAQNAPQRRAR